MSNPVRIMYASLFSAFLLLAGCGGGGSNNQDEDNGQNGDNNEQQNEEESANLVSLFIQGFLGFGQLVNDEVAERQVRIINPGSEPITITAIDVASGDPAFTIAASDTNEDVLFPLSIEADDSYDIIVSINSAGKTFFDDKLVIETTADDTQHGHVPVSFTVVDTVNEALRFSGQVFDGQNGVTGLDRANKIARSIDGDKLLVSSSTEGTLAIFSRDAQTGDLIFRDALRDFAVTEERTASFVNPFEGVNQIIFNSNGTEAVVTSGFHAIVTVLSIDDDCNITVKEFIDLSANDFDRTPKRTLAVHFEADQKLRIFAETIDDTNTTHISYLEYIEEPSGFVRDLDRDMVLDEITLAGAFSPDGNHAFFVSNNNGTQVNYIHIHFTATNTITEVSRSEEDPLATENIVFIEFSDDSSQALITGRVSDSLTVVDIDDINSRQIFQDGEDQVTGLNGAEGVTVDDEGYAIVTSSDGIARFQRQVDERIRTFVDALVEETVNRDLAEVTVVEDDIYATDESNDQIIRINTDNIDDESTLDDAVIQTFFNGQLGGAQGLGSFSASGPSSMAALNESHTVLMDDNGFYVYDTSLNFPHIVDDFTGVPLSNITPNAIAAGNGTIAVGSRDFDNGIFGVLNIFSFANNTLSFSHTIEHTGLSGVKDLAFSEDSLTLYAATDDGFSGYITESANEPYHLWAAVDGVDTDGDLANGAEIVEICEGNNKIMVASGLNDSEVLVFTHESEDLVYQGNAGNLNLGSSAIRDLQCHQDLLFVAGSNSLGVVDISDNNPSNYAVTNTADKQALSLEFDSIAQILFASDAESIDLYDASLTPSATISFDDLEGAEDLGESGELSLSADRAALSVRGHSTGAVGYFTWDPDAL